MAITQIRSRCWLRYPATNWVAGFSTRERRHESHSKNQSALRSSRRRHGSAGTDPTTCAPSSDDGYCFSRLRASNDSLLKSAQGRYRDGCSAKLTPLGGYLTHIARPPPTPLALSSRRDRRPKTPRASGHLCPAPPSTAVLVFDFFEIWICG